MTATITDLSARLAAITGDQRPAAPVAYKADAPCCAARRDDLGRLPVGYCSDGCERRRWMPITGDTVDVAVAHGDPLLPWGTCS